jgi:hypothetical protein
VVTKSTDHLIACRRTADGKAGSTARKHRIETVENRPQPERYGPRIQSRTCSGGVRNKFLHAHAARGLSAINTTSGTITVRDQ